MILTEKYSASIKPLQKAAYAYHESTLSLKNLRFVMVKGWYITDLVSTQSDLS